MNQREVRSILHTIQKRKKSHGMIDDLDNIDFYFFKRQFFLSGSFVVCIRRQRSSEQDVIKGRSPTMRHVSGTHRVALDWLFDRINLDPQNPNQIR